MPEDYFYQMILSFWSVSLFYCAGLLLFGHKFRMLAIFWSGQQIMIPFGYENCVNQAKGNQNSKSKAISCSNYTLGMCDVIRTKFLNRKGLKIKNALKRLKYGL